MAATPPNEPAAYPGTNVSISTTTMSTSQLQRAYCLLLARTLWPTINVRDALRVAGWMMNGATGGPE